MIKLVVGLGNPGLEYQQTRHNAGFWWLEALASQTKVVFHLDRTYKGLVARGITNGSSFWLLMPQTFMNLSGQSVATLVNFYKIAPDQILVVHDELDLPPGQVKLKLGGGHAGHNGLRDIHAQLGSNNYWRLRLGIGHPGVRQEVASWVLQKPPIEQKQLIDAAIVHSLKAAPLIFSGDMVQATKLIHTQPASLSSSIPPRVECF